MYEGLTELHKRWIALWPDVKREKALNAFGHLVARYSEPTRFYHNLVHIRHGLDVIEEHMALTLDLHAVRLAFWFHDVIYNSKAKDNEVQSADFAANELQRLGASHALCLRVHKLVIATKHSVPLESPDEVFITDVDLTSLGGRASDYNAYSEAIRKEYEWVPIDTYRKGRTKILEGFLDRGIFTSDHFRHLYGAQARANITREIKELQLMQ